MILAQSCYTYCKTLGKLLKTLNRGKSCSWKSQTSHLLIFQTLSWQLHLAELWLLAPGQWPCHHGAARVLLHGLQASVANSTAAQGASQSLLGLWNNRLTVLSPYIMIQADVPSVPQTQSQLLGRCLPIVVRPSLVLSDFFFEDLSINLCEREWEWVEGQRERNSNRLHAECRARCGAWSHDPNIRPELKPRVESSLSTPIRGPSLILFLIYA